MKLKFKLKSDADVCLIQGDKMYLVSKKDKQTVMHEVRIAHKDRKLKAFDIRTSREGSIEINPALPVYTVDKNNLNPEIVDGLDKLNIDWAGSTTEQLVGYHGVTFVALNPKYLIPTGDYRVWGSGSKFDPTVTESGNDKISITIEELSAELPDGDYFDRTGAVITKANKTLKVITSNYFLANFDEEEISNIHQLLVTPVCAKSNNKQLCYSPNVVRFNDAEILDLLNKINTILIATDANPKEVAVADYLWRYFDLVNLIMEACLISEPDAEDFSGLLKDEENENFIKQAVQEFRIAEAAEALRAKNEEQAKLETSAPMTIVQDAPEEVKQTKGGRKKSKEITD